MLEELFFFKESDDDFSSQIQVTRDADFASALNNTIVRRGKLELMMSYFIWGIILESRFSDVKNLKNKQL